MASFTSLVVYFVIVPLMAVLLSFVVPVAFLRRSVAGLVQVVERPLGGSNVTLLPLVAVITSFAFLMDVMAWQNAFKDQRKHFPDLSLKLQHETKRLRLERNLYIYMLASALCLSVKMIAALTRAQSHSQAQSNPQAGRQAAAAAPAQPAGKKTD